MLNLEELTAEVFVTRDPIVCWGTEELEFIRLAAGKSPRRRARICAHKANDDTLHEMLIALAAGGYIRPHKHTHKAESFHILEGDIDVFIFETDGTPAQVISLSSSDTKKSFYYRLPPNIYHTVFVKSEFASIHEVTNGPFDPQSTIQAPFAPAETDTQSARTYMESISRAAGISTKIL
jgi:cupin fold WbuC family metalloprotein